MEERLPLLMYPKDVQKLIGVCTTKFYELNKLSDFPKEVFPVPGRPMYKTKEILEWVNGLDDKG